MTEYMVDDERYMNRLPPERAPVGVLGAGPMGLLGAMALRAWGFSTYVYSREAAPNPKAELTAAIGATYVSAASDDVAALARRVGSICVVYEAAGASQLAFDTMPFLGINGVFIFTGVPGRKAPISVDTDLLMRDFVLKNQVVYGTVNAGRDAFEAAITDLGVFAARWPEAVRGLIAGHYPIERFGDLLLGTPGGIKNLITLQ